MERAHSAIQTLILGCHGQVLDSVDVWELLTPAVQENPAMVLREIAKYPYLYKSNHYMEYVKVR